MEILIAKYWKPLAVVGMIVFASLQTWRIERLHRELITAKAAAAQQAQLAADTEHARALDHTAAQRSYDAMNTRCIADVAQAIGKGRTIERIISAPLPAPGTARGIVDAIVLQSLVGPPPPDTSAITVSTGSDDARN